MSVDRLERVNSLLRRAIGESLYRVFAGDTLDLACITVTTVETSRNLRNATVYVSILGHDDERGIILRKLANKADALQSIINRELTLKYTPRLRFVLDDSVAKGDHVLDILSHLDIPKDNSSDRPT
jgi:ribosome-binding factor A